MQTASATRDGTGNPERHARAVVERSRTSFFWAMRRMPPAKRQAMYAIYAFCREIDDIADEPGEPAEKREALERYRQDIGSVYAGGGPTLPAVVALAGPVREHGLEAADFNALIDGMLTDAAPAVRIGDQRELDEYVDRVACAVGRLSCRVFGLPAAEQAPLARSLGSALQLTNILRDVREDAQRDRLYLPADMLRDAGLEALDAPIAVDHPAIAAVCRTLADQAGAHFEAADAIMGRCPPTDVRPARMMRVAYGRLLDRVVAQGFAPLPSVRVSLSAFEKATLALRYGIL